MSPTKTQDSSSITLVIPCYKEAYRLPTFLGSLIEVMPSEMRIIIVDDGSPEMEYHLLKNKLDPLLNSKIALRRYDIHRGKGGAIRFGLEYAETTWLGFLDADGSVPAYEVIRLWNIARESKDMDLIISSRFQNVENKVIQSPLRKLLRRIFSVYLRFLFQTPFQDTQCGFKIFKATIYEELRIKLMDEGWLWDTELVILAFKYGFKCVEVSIDWKDIIGSKINLISDSFKMARGLYDLRNRLKDSTL